MKIAIITARGGSKRIPEKNIKPFCGKPIIEYSIQAALKSGLFDEVMVSTDSQKIADVALSCGAKVPFFRSEKNSDDYSTTYEVLCEVLEEYLRLGISFDRMCCIYPTAPFVTSDKLRMADKMIDNPNIDAVFPVTKFSYPPQRSLVIRGDYIGMKDTAYMLSRSQDLEPLYHDSGQFYFVKVKQFLKEKKLFLERSAPIIVSDTEVQDIDTIDDWKIAELKFLSRYTV